MSVAGGALVSAFGWELSYFRDLRRGTIDSSPTPPSNTFYASISGITSLSTDEATDND